MVKSYVQLERRKTTMKKNLNYTWAAHVVTVRLPTYLRLMFQLDNPLQILHIGGQYKNPYKNLFLKSKFETIANFLLECLINAIQIM